MGPEAQPGLNSGPPDPQEVRLVRRIVHPPLGIIWGVPDVHFGPLRILVGGAANCNFEPEVDIQLLIILSLLGQLEAFW